MIVFYKIKGHEKYLINKNGEVLNTKTNGKSWEAVT